MADLTVSEFRARFPQFVDPPYTDAIIQAAIDDTLCNFDQDRWECDYKRGHSLYIAHLLTLGQQQSSGDSGTSLLDADSGQSADGVSYSVAALAPSSYTDAFFSGTSYGREYLMLQKKVGIGATCVGCL
jgi:hypothetical protein